MQFQSQYPSNYPKPHEIYTMTRSCITNVAWKIKEGLIGTTPPPSPPPFYSAGKIVYRIESTLYFEYFFKICAPFLTLELRAIMRLLQFCMSRFLRSSFSNNSKKELDLICKKRNDLAIYSNFFFRTDCTFA